MPARDNALQGDFGEAWLQVVAAGCGILHDSPGTVDREKADVLLTLLGHVMGTYNPSVKVQVKTATNPRMGDDGTFNYDLDIATYDVLRREDHAIRRVLVVIGLPEDKERVRLLDDGTLLVGRGAWVSLEGEQSSDNTTTQVVRLPVTNTLDCPGLERMLSTYGVRRSTPVPEVDVWAVTESTEGGSQ